MQKPRLTPVLSFALATLWVATSVHANIIGVSDSGPCQSNPAPSTAGEPFGFVDGEPFGNNGASGILTLVGWALDDDGVQRVDIRVDGQIVGSAEYGRQRPDVAAFYPGFPGASFSGWLYRLDTTRFTNGEHQVSALAWSNAGEVRPLNTLVFSFLNNPNHLRPFGQIRFPDHSATLYGTCDVTNADRHYSTVEGWALDVGVENNDHGIGWVELLLDGRILANTRLNCTNSVVTGAWSNCYGRPLADVERAFVGVKDAPNAGFRFVMDVGALIDFGHAEGQHVLTIRANDLDTQFENIDSINVNFACDEFFQNRGSIGAFDSEQPRDSGTIQLSGWALDRQGISRVRIVVDGDFVGFATYGFSRPAVTSQHPSFPDSQAPGWQFALDTRGLANTRHDAFAVAIDHTGNHTTIGQITFGVENP